MSAPPTITIPREEHDALEAVVRAATLVAAGPHVDPHEREQALDALPHLLDHLAATRSTAPDTRVPAALVAGAAVGARPWQLRALARQMTNAAALAAARVDEEILGPLVPPKDEPS